MLLCAAEVDGKNPPSRLQNPSNLSRALLPGLPWQMVQHQSTQDNIESTVRRRQLLGYRQLERDLRARFGRLPSRPGNHLRRGVDAVDFTCRPDVPCHRNRQGTSPTADIENRVPAFETRQADDALAEGLFPAARQQP